MKGQPRFADEPLAPTYVSAWSAGVDETLRRADPRRLDLRCGLDGELRETDTCLWLLFRIENGARLGLRVMFDLGRIQSPKVVRRSATEAEITAEGGMGRYDIVLTSPDPAQSLIRCQVALTPAEPLKIKPGPRDLCLFSEELELFEGRGRLFTCQTGATAGQLFFNLGTPDGGTVFYFQNFSALEPYVRQTGAKLGSSVSVEWPDCGFCLPEGEQPLEKGKRIVIRDTFLRIWSEPAPGEAMAAERFIEALAGIHPLLQQPEAPYFDWPAMAQRTLRMLGKSKGCFRKVDGKAYFHAYVGGAGKPPESMVQGALLVPLTEYEQWQRRPVPLLKAFQHFPRSFFDDSVGSPVRWLLSADFEKDERSEEESHYRMDSWYLLHTCLNICRLGEMGHEESRDIFLASLDKLIKTAHRFDYDWPVFYDQRNLRVFKQETQSGEGGEQDASGLYLKVMAQAYALTRDPKHLEEAETAAAKLGGLNFGLLYQTNTTAMTAASLALLWRTTGNRRYRDLSVICLGSILSHLWLWHLGPETRTFMALPPLHDAPYVAFYEEAEVLACFHLWLSAMGDDAPPGSALLLAEYQKHLLARASAYYPENLPPEQIAEPKDGILRRSLAVPLEGLGPPGDKAGTVGQAVYAAGAPFILTTRCWQRPKPAPFMIFCAYPLLDQDYSGDPKSGVVHARVAGSPALSAQLRILPLRRRMAAPRIELADGTLLNLTHDREKGWVASVPGGARLAIAWGPQ